MLLQRSPLSPGREGLLTYRTCKSAPNCEEGKRLPNLTPGAGSASPPGSPGPWGRVAGMAGMPGPWKNAAIACELTGSQRDGRPRSPGDRHEPAELVLRPCCLVCKVTSLLRPTVCQAHCAPGTSTPPENPLLKGPLWSDCKPKPSSLWSQRLFETFS